VGHTVFLSMKEIFVILLSVLAIPFKPVELKALKLSSIHFKETLAESG
jgi:hypothetical protein